MNFLTFTAYVFLFFCSNFAYATPSVNVLGPLMIGDPKNLNSEFSKAEWNKFREQLSTLKAAGVNGISTDIWWGVVEAAGPGKYDWKYYEKMAKIIKKSGLEWIPILSFHQLGGNIGDKEYYSPLPEWVWNQIPKKQGKIKSAEDFMFKSEQGNLSKESLSVWASDLRLPDIQRFMENFQKTFKEYAPIIPEINISLGPAGELRYPSYNAHDYNAGYLTRGSLQSYSKPAIASFQAYAKKKYGGSIKKLNKSWGYNLNSFSEVFPPNPELLKNDFWEKKEHFSPYGKDFFDWYNQSLVEHGKNMLHAAAQVFKKSDSKMKAAQISAKIPGVHWRLSSDRLSELTAGLIRTSYPNWYHIESKFGYADTLKVFYTPQKKNKFLLHFTALELDDGHETDTNHPKTLARWIALGANKEGIEIKGENAISEELSKPRAWENIEYALVHYNYSGITLLRSNEIANDPAKLSKLKHIIDNLKLPTCEDQFKNL